MSTTPEAETAVVEEFAPAQRLPSAPSLNPYVATVRENRAAPAQEPAATSSTPRERASQTVPPSTFPTIEQRVEFRDTIIRETQRVFAPDETLTRPRPSLGSPVPPRDSSTIRPASRVSQPTVAAPTNMRRADVHALPTPPAMPEVNIHIGRVELLTPSPSQPSRREPARAERKHMSLEDYLLQRKEKHR